MRYRRAWQPGGTFFFTVTLKNRKQTLLTDHITALRQAFTQVRSRHPFDINAVVILPEHLHTIWTLPEGDTDYAQRWRLIKSAFSRQLPVTEWRNQSRMYKGERGIWQRRYWEHLIRDDSDYHHHLNYIHFNPVKHGYADTVQDWPFSSFHRYVKAGVLPRDWASGGSEKNAASYGE